MREELNKSYYQNDLVKSKRMLEEASKKIVILEKRDSEDSKTSNPHRKDDHQDTAYASIGIV